MTIPGRGLWSSSFGRSALARVITHPKSWSCCIVDQAKDVDTDDRSGIDSDNSSTLYISKPSWDGALYDPISVAPDLSSFSPWKVSYVITIQVRTRLCFFKKRQILASAPTNPFTSTIFSSMNFFDIPHLSVVFFLKILFQEAWEK